MIFLLLHPMRIIFYANCEIVAGARPWSGSTNNTSQIRTIDTTNGTTIRYV
jgi:hypothetical protein